MVKYLKEIIYSLAKRAAKLETVINSIVTKIDSVLVKVEKMDISKNKRKTAITKILGTINENEGSYFTN